MLKTYIIIGSTRPNRFGDAVGKWIYDLAKQRSDMEVELIDLADIDLPLLDEPIPPKARQYTKQHTKDWSEKIDAADAYIFVTAEYNHGIPAALKNALDFVYHEWNNKVAGFVSYGASANGTRAVEQLRLVTSELQLATVRDQVDISIMTDIDEQKRFRANERHVQNATAMLDELALWGTALKSARATKE